jgi:class 3 adenylate cyclase/tetratricopeptide (TPR) repeat protein
MLNCPNCRFDNPDGARFCSNCGSPLDAVRNIEGERKLVTVLFADVAGSTAMAERLDAEDWAAIMNGAFGFMNTAVRRYEGTVARLMGDAVLAFFGAPQAHEDDPERAVRAALEIRDAAASYAAALRAEYGLDFGVRVGINTGMVVLGVLGDETRSEYTAMGDTANVAARLQSFARAGAVLITADTWRLVRHAFEAVPRGLVGVKGKSAPIETYEVIAPRTAPVAARGVEGLNSPLVGRDAELERLRSRVTGLRHGTGAVLAILGEAGLGKSRLVTELRAETESAQGSAPQSAPQSAPESAQESAQESAPESVQESAPGSLRWLECRSVSYGQSLAYHPWKQLGHAIIGATTADSPATVRDRLHAFCRRAGVADEDVPYLETMLSVELEAGRTAIGRAEVERGQPMADAVIRAIRASIHAGGSVTPHVLVFDDLHWADGASIDLLASVATLAYTEPLLVLCVLRPDRGAPSWALIDRLRGSMGDRYGQIQLDPLDRARTSQLLANLLDVKDMPPAVRTLIMERSEGNPFFLEEVIRSLIDSGHLMRENGHWRATAEIASVTIPDTLAGVLAARIDRLPEPTKRVAQAAAVLGRVFLHRALSTVCSRAPEPDRIANVEPHLGTLRYEELVREKASLPEREYIFKHALTQETAYNLLLKRRRRELHRLAGNALEELFPDRVDELAPVLAYHFEQGGDPQRTVDYSIRAAEGAVRLFALVEANDHYQRAWDALHSQPQPDPVLLIDTALEWTIVRYRLHRYEQLIERLLEVEALARTAGDMHRLAQVLSWLGLVHMVTGFPSRSESYIVESNTLASELGEEQLMLLPFFFATDAMIDRDPRGTIDQMREVIQLARKHHMPEIEGHGLAATAIAFARLGDFAQANDFIAQALAAAPSGGHRVKEADVHLLVGLAYMEMGRMDDALAHLRVGTDLARAENALECVCAGEYGLGIGELENRRVDEALRQFGIALETADRAGMGGWSGFVNRIRAGLAVARLQSGSPAALEDLELALANAVTGQDEYQAAIVSEQLAGVHLDTGQPERAAELLENALGYYRRTGMLPYEARALGIAARVYERRGAADAARRALERAAELRDALAAAAPAAPAAGITGRLAEQPVMDA